MFPTTDWNSRAEQIARSNGEATLDIFSPNQFRKIRNSSDREKYLDTHYRINCQISHITGLPIQFLTVKIFAAPCKIQKPNVYYRLNFPETAQSIKTQYIENYQAVVNSLSFN